MIILSIILGLFGGLCAFFFMVVLGEYSMAVSMGIITGCLISMGILSVFLITDRKIRIKRDIITKQLSDSAYLSSLGSLRFNGKSEPISFFVCYDCFYINFTDKKNKDLKILFDDVDKVYCYMDTNFITIKSKHLDDIELQLYDVIDLTESSVQNKTEFRK